MQASLEAFARLLLSLLHDKTPTEFNAVIRQHVLPLQSFDKRWRSEIPATLDETDPSQSQADDDERSAVLREYKLWSVSERRRSEEERKRRAKKGKERASEPESRRDRETGHDDHHDDDETGPLEVKPDKWIEAKELLE